MKVASDGIRLLRGSTGLEPAQLADVERNLRFAEISQAQAGLMDDMDLAATAIYATAPHAAG